MTEVLITSMDWFLYDRQLRHERVEGSLSWYTFVFLLNEVLSFTQGQLDETVKCPQHFAKFSPLLIWLTPIVTSLDIYVYIYI